VPAIANGGRHPGPWDAANLRGLTEERGSRSVRPSVAGLVPMQAIAPATTGALWKEEEGNVVSVREAHALFVLNAHALFTLEDTSFARSRDPCTSLSTFTFDAKALRGEVGRFDSVSMSGKPAQAGGTGRAGLKRNERTNVRLAACHRSRKRGRA